MASGLWNTAQGNSIWTIQTPPSRSYKKWSRGHTTSKPPERPCRENGSRKMEPRELMHVTCLPAPWRPSASAVSKHHRWRGDVSDACPFEVWRCLETSGPTCRIMNSATPLQTPAPLGQLFPQGRCAHGRRPREPGGLCAAPPGEAEQHAEAAHPKRDVRQQAVGQGAGQPGS